MLTKRMGLLAKLEGTYDTDPTPVVASNAIRCEGLQINPAGDTFTERPAASEFLIQPQAVHGGNHWTISFTTEVKGIGTGTADTAPEIGPLFEGCGFSKTTDSTASQEYTEYAYDSDPANHGSLTFYAYLDGQLRKFTGCRGTAVATLKAREVSKIAWTFTGHEASSSPFTDSALVAVQANWNKNALPPTVSNIACTLGGTSMDASQITVDFGVQIGIPDDVTGRDGYGDVVITGIAPTFNMDPLAVLKATWDPWALKTGSTLGAMVIGPVGSSLNNKFRLSCAKAQVKNVEYGDRNGQMGYTISGDLRDTEGTGDDALKFRFGYTA